MKFLSCCLLPSLACLDDDGDDDDDDDGMGRPTASSMIVNTTTFAQWRKLPRDQIQRPHRITAYYDLNCVRAPRLGCHGHWTDGLGKLREIQTPVEKGYTHYIPATRK